MLKNMKAYGHLKPGQRGTHRLVEQYGDSLVCVRYRYDELRGVKLKTAEIVVDEKPCGCRPGYRDKDMVAIVVGYTEKKLRESLKAAGGRWDPAEKLWRVSYGAIKANPDLIERIVKEDAGYRYR